MLENITKKIVALVPGTKLNIAAAKQKMERRLRAEGYSRSQAVTMASLHFKKPLQAEQ